ncbi:MAG: DUF302 domain-containing protein [Gemmatimonadales bacterium]|nr:DUF302 domain-containing protein [Gemmatimonadales bacterium]
MMQPQTSYAMGTELDLPFPEALSRARAALAREGFGVVTEIDMPATLQRKLGVDFKPYVILGACNPSLAYEALLQEPDIGLLLPCNVVVYEDGGPGRSVVSAVDPVESLRRAGNPALAPLAQEVKARLERVLDAVRHPA